MHQPNPVISALDVAQEHTKGDVMCALLTINHVITAIKLAIMLEFIKPNSPNKRTHKQ